MNQDSSERSSSSMAISGDDPTNHRHEAAVSTLLGVQDSELDRFGSNRLDVYLGVSRVGVVVLEFLPDAQGGPQVQYVELIQTPGEAMGLWVRNDPDSGDRQLMVANTYAGIRVYGPAH